MTLTMLVAKSFSANYVAKTNYAHGNNLLVSTCPSATLYSQTFVARNSVRR